MCLDHAHEEADLDLIDRFSAIEVILSSPEMVKRDLAQPGSREKDSPSSWSQFNNVQCLPFQ